MAATPIKFGVPLDMEQLEILSLRLEQRAADPSTPVPGQMWYNTTTGIAKIYMDGAIISFFSASDANTLSVQGITITAIQQDISDMTAEIDAISSDNVLSKSEKPRAKSEYDIILAEQQLMEDLADTYSVTTEKQDYIDAIDALTTYLGLLDPAYDDFTQDTVIVGATFRSKFEDVYIAKQTLQNVCAATSGDSVETVIDGGIITTGRIEIGNKTGGNAGINGGVTASPNTDIRFWSGATYANRATAPWRVQNDGTFYATVGNIGGWTVDANSLFSGTKVAGDGFATNAGDMTIKSDGSIHTKNFYINADGSIGIIAVASFKTSPESSVATVIQGGHIWENDFDNDDSTLQINWKGYQGGGTRFRRTLIGDGKQGNLYLADGNAKNNIFFEAMAVGHGGSASAPNSKAVLDLQSTTKGLLVPRMTTTQMNAITSPPEGLIIYNTTIPAFCGYTAAAWWRFGMV